MSIQIIAEAGVNHNGCLDTAHKLVDKSKESGADAVKFQTFNADTIATCDAAKAKYQINGNKNETQYNMLRNLELGVKDYIELKKHCELIDIEFMSTAFGKKELDILINCGIKSIKVASGEITNKPLLEYMAKQSYKKKAPKVKYLQASS